MGLTTSYLRATQYLRATFAMARPYFLAGTVPLYLVGVAVAYRRMGSLALDTAILGLALVWSVQLLTHFYNEFHDLETDQGSAGSLVTGGSQALVETDIPPATARWLGRGAALVAFGLTGLLLWLGSGMLLVPIVALALVGGWTYSSPPVRLVSRGLGELTIVALGSVLVPITGYYLQVGAVGGGLQWPILTLVPLNVGLTLATALPDVESDRATGKDTLAVRLGPGPTTALAAGVFLLGCAIGIWTIEQLYPGAWLLGAFGTVLIAAFAAPFLRPTYRGDRQGAGRFALVITAAFGTIAFVIVGTAILGA